MKKINIPTHQLDEFYEREAKRKIDHKLIKKINKEETFIMYEQATYLYRHFFKPTFTYYSSSSEDRGKILILTGSFHVGKSSLINYTYTHLTIDIPEEFSDNGKFPVYSVRYNAKVKNGVDFILWLCAKIGTPINSDFIKEWRQCSSNGNSRKRYDLFVYENALKIFMDQCKSLNLKLLFIDEIQRIEGMRIDLEDLLSVIKDLSDANTWKQNKIDDFKTAIVLVGTDQFDTFLTTNKTVTDTIKWLRIGLEGRTIQLTLNPLRHRDWIEGGDKIVKRQNDEVSEFEDFVSNTYLHYREIAIDPTWDLVQLKMENCNSMKT